jgi:hypothetical protein
MKIGRRNRSTAAAPQIPQDASWSPRWFPVLRYRETGEGRTGTWILRCVAGIPEINVDRFEPLYLAHLSLSKGHGPVTISGSFSNVLAHGPSNATATSAT